VAYIPFGPEQVNRAAGDGICLAETAPRAAVTKSIRKLAETLCQSFRHPEVENRGTRVPSA
jgi:Flp pilus assembly CpaE family ATPase